jgi:hypothetical protein
VTVNFAFAEKWLPSLGDCEISVQPRFPEPWVSLAATSLVGGVTGVDVASLKMKVGVSVGVAAAVWVGGGVTLGVGVGEKRAAVWVAAAAAV